MSLFDKNTVEESSDELLYTILVEELEKKAEQWDAENNRVGVGIDKPGVYIYDANRVIGLKRFSKVILQYLWKKLGKKLPDLTRNYVDKNGELINYKQND